MDIKDLCYSHVWLNLWHYPVLLHLNFTHPTCVYNLSIWTSLFRKWSAIALFKRRRADHEGIRDKKNSSMADECGDPSTTSGCIYNSLALRIVRRGGRLRKALVATHNLRVERREAGRDRIIREGTIVGSCIQYSMHRRPVCVVVGAPQPIKLNLESRNSSNVVRNIVVISENY